MNLEFAKGDQFLLEIPITDNEDNLVQKSDIDEITMTCRKIAIKDSAIIFEKKLSKNDITYNTETKMFETWIKKEDSSDMYYGTYGYDIEIIAGETITTKTGIMNITEEYSMGE
jgi:hypothetical protein